MAETVDLYNSTYGNFADRVLALVRKETYGEDIGQNSWITAEEYDRFYQQLALPPGPYVLEVASGSGGPSLYLARKHGCRITGVDINAEGLNTARKAASAAKIDHANFEFADMNERLPFESNTFHGILCVDSMNHFRDRLHVLREWHRTLKPGGRILFTDPVVLTGPVSNEELASRSNIGFFLFVPLEVTKHFILEAGFTLIHCDDVTSNVEHTSRRWHASREKYREDLLKIEGKDRYEGLQKFLAAVHQLTSERRLSRFLFVAKK